MLGMIDPIWAGVVGGAVGGGFTTLATILGARNERNGRLDELDKTRDIAEDKARREYKQKLVTDWRIGLAQAAQDEAEWGRLMDLNAVAPIRPTVTGQVWFESLRPHLAASEAGLQALVFGAEVSYDPVRGLRLADEIARIEREWGLI
ncbi:hypothetical protein CH256_17455 [Rhodococcus sp. 05-2254-6]|nr:hypothetical protein CH256_17455 [Rhodococcus sp. 05-2254-6]